MKDYIIKAIKDKIENLRSEYATNYIATKWQETQVTNEDGTVNADAQKQVDAGNFNMAKYETQIKYLESLLETENQK